MLTSASCDQHRLGVSGLEFTPTANCQPPTPSELDFQHEAANAERCRANLASPKSRLCGR